MAHGIMELDRLAVGFTELYGTAWHNHPNCEHLEGAVPFKTAEGIFGYQVEKVPLVIAGTDIESGSFALIRRDEEVITVLYPSVLGRYEVIQNFELLAWVEAGILVPYNVSLESVGTLLNGQKSFVNVILNEHTVPGDESATVTRLMYSNSFGGDSYQACVHTTRIVCDNTLRISTAQGATNQTLKKFRHTKNAAQKIEGHLVELSDLIATVREHHDQMDVLAQITMNSAQVSDFFDALIPLQAEDGRGKTRRQNQRDAILAIFEGKDDLQGKIARTRYAMMQAVTDWADHDSSVRNGDDEGGRFWDGIWGNKDKFKQKAFDAIVNKKVDVAEETDDI